MRINDHYIPCPTCGERAWYVIGADTLPPEQGVGYRGGVEFDTYAERMDDPDEPHEPTCPDRIRFLDGWGDDEDQIAEDVWERACHEEREQERW